AYPLNAHSEKKTAVLIVAAGSGERMGGAGPKQYFVLHGMSLLERSVRAFQANAQIGEIRVMIHPDHRTYYDKACSHLGLGEPLIGGASRQESVRNGLKAMSAHAPQYILVHDAARPFVSQQLIDRVIHALNHSQGVIPVIPVTDTLKEVIGQHVTATPIRSTMRAVQTPQGFNFQALLQAHLRFADASATDDASLLEMDGIDVTVVEGEAINRKLTTPDDWQWAQMQEQETMAYATGQGFDVHRFIAHSPDVAPSERVVRLGGISIAHTHRLEGHSDADAVLHALTDALLGTVGAGDIGQHFPPSDAKWKGADSEVFLTEAMKKLTLEGAKLQHVDITILCEAPKIGPHREKMRAHLAQLLKLPLKRVNVKATTTERLGFTGREEGLAAMAIATVSLAEEAAV
ncbi:MAG: bifunctional 2-C-methyl-D-erythritol 4-phosphate cytidylyltransferase/2-C-methyl-D-erythritol 2,4-cyclodiphosphate synthase, partial [Rickettsiales bacterium]|nr:bifunctional 2-C-methyl-D-erythritol 4-phosphate cytidylyltransferase/2-C-methyl-D-erythritol 2,4-cyclodiphosphate synthase [Rickettsiales bacterium]